MNRTFLSEIEFSVSDYYFEDPTGTDYPDVEEWEFIRGELYEQNSEKYVYLKKDDLDRLLDGNSISIGYEADVSVDLGDEIDLGNVDNVNLSIS